jgi:DNA-binding MarR family transcriptional regulator
MSSPPSDRDDPRAALQGELARSGGLSVLLSQAIADRVGVVPTDLEAMDLLRQSGPIPAGRLAELTGLTTAAVTGLLDRLERRGWARREPDPSDRRRVIVRPLLENAESELEPFYAGIGQATADLIARYGEAEIALLLDFLLQSNAIVAAQIALVRSAESAGGRTGTSMPPAAE